jgi:site-specific recombinase XerD
MTEITPKNRRRKLVPTLDASMAFQSAAETVAASSARVYRQTFKLWQEWCARNGVDELDMNFGNVQQFLNDAEASKATKQRQLAALRTAVRVLAALDPQRSVHWQQLLEGLKLIKPRHVSHSGRSRKRIALTPKEVYRAVSVFEGNRLLDIRNRALVAVLFYTGLRRAEVAALRWEDIDLENGIIHVAHGKGDKARDVAIVEDSDNAAIEALSQWKEVQQRLAGKPYQFVFCALYKNDKLGPDAPMSTNAIWKLTKIVAKHSGVDLSPHTARRTLATELLDQGASLADVQAQLGHANEATTLRYARPAEARKRRERFKVRY